MSLRKIGWCFWVFLLLWDAKKTSAERALIGKHTKRPNCTHSAQQTTMASKISHMRPHMEEVHNVVMAKKEKEKKKGPPPQKKWYRCLFNRTHEMEWKTIRSDSWGGSMMAVLQKHTHTHANARCFSADYKRKIRPLGFETNVRIAFFLGVWWKKPYPLVRIYCNSNGLQNYPKGPVQSQRVS